MKLMKKTTLLLIFVMLFTLLSACTNDSVEQPMENEQASGTKEEPKTLEGDHFEILRANTEKFLKGNDLGSISAKEVYQKVVIEEDINYHVVDVRSAESFAAGHIEGAVNIPYNLSANPKLIESLPTDKKIVVACYSGHTAGQTAAFWQMIGYDAVPMVNGMGGWTSVKGVGTPFPTMANGYPVVKEAVKASSNPLPSFKAEIATDVKSLIIQRSQNYLASGKGPVVNSETLKNIIDSKNSDYLLVDIRGSEDYSKGHIEGAINIPAQDIAQADNLKKLPTDKKLIIIGYNGTDGSQVTRALNQLGYDSYAFLFGMRVWTSDAEINGIAPVSAEVIVDYPLEELNYDLEGGSGGSASCG